MNRWLGGFLTVLLCAPVASAQDDAQRIEQRLHEFLAGVSAGDAQVHQWFWAEDLVYTSSSGERFGKAQIIAPEEPAAEATAEATATAQANPVYRAEDVDVRVYDDAAVLAFRLVAESRDMATAEISTTAYYNTGTLLRRDGQWVVVAWQATRIP